MTFSDIPGKEDIKQQLVSLVKQDKLPHAILFLGPEGSGKLAMAIALANYVQCMDKQEHNVCQACSACQKALKNIHPDIHFTYPVGKLGSKARKDITSIDFLKHWRTRLDVSPYISLDSWQAAMGDTNTAPNINTTECKNILHHLSLQTFEGSHKVQIIWQSQFLGKEGNRLLKLIEEPTPNTLLILIAEHEEGLLNTIVSRCQIFKMKPFTDAEIVDYTATKGIKVTERELFLANGNLCAALQFKDGAQVEYSDLVLNWMRVSWQSHPDHVFPFIDNLMGLGKEERLMFIQYSIHFFRQYLIYIYTKDHNKVRLVDKEKDIILKMVKIIDYHKATQILEKLEEGLVLLNRNINAKIMFTKYTLYFGEVLKSAA